MEYEGGHDSFDRDLQLINDECTTGLSERTYIPIALPASPDPPTEVVPGALPQVNCPLDEDQAQRGIKRKCCSSSLTPSNEQQLIRQLDLHNPATFRDLGFLTDTDFGIPEGSPVLEDVLSPPGSSSMSSSSWTQSPVLLHSSASSTQLEDYASPPTAGVISDSATRTSPIPESKSNNGMPSAAKLELSVGYMNKKRKMYNITKEDGFLLFHEKTPDPARIPKDCAFIRCPDPDISEDGSDPQSKLDEKQAKYVRKILDNMWGGLQVRSQQGCIYATRWSKAKIYCRSYETRHNQHRDRMSDVVELPRGQERMVFNLNTFKERIKAEYTKKYALQEVQTISQSEQTRRDKDLVQMINPTIYFTFAQKWAPDCHPLNTCLVWAQLKPCQALYDCEALFHAKHNSLDDFHSELLQLSMGSLTIDQQANRCS